METFPTDSFRTARSRFRLLSPALQRQHFEDVARRALPFWGFPRDTPLRLLNITENATFLADHPAHGRLVVRVHRLDYASRPSVESELAWIRHLRDAGIPAVEPIPARDGSPVISMETPELEETRNVTCFSFVPGKAPRDSQDDSEDIGDLTKVVAPLPKWLTVPVFRLAATLYDLGGRRKKAAPTLTPEDRELYRTLGAQAARMHLLAPGWQPPHPDSRITWTWETTFSPGWNNYYGVRFHQKGNLLPSRDIPVLEACADLIRTRTEAYGKSGDRFGMIHSDLRMSNLLMEGKDLTILDFDDCGEGWFMYDLACITGFMEHRPDLSAVQEAILEGYLPLRPLDPEDIREIPTFVMMRRMGLLQALMYHIDDTVSGNGESAQLCPEILAFYARGTVHLARRFLRTFRDIPLARPCPVPDGTSRQETPALTQGVLA